MGIKKGRAMSGVARTRSVTRGRSRNQRLQVGAWKLQPCRKVRSHSRSDNPDPGHRPHC